MGASGEINLGVHFFIRLGRSLKKAMLKEPRTKLLSYIPMYEETDANGAGVTLSGT